MITLGLGLEPRVLFFKMTLWTTHPIRVEQGCRAFLEPIHSVYVDKVNGQLHSWFLQMSSE